MLKPLPVFRAIRGNSVYQNHEVRIHGRGGQGAVLACSILAQALIDDGKHAVAIPSFGFERRGAPVAAFLRFSDAPIRAMTNVYHPDCVVCIDPTVHRTIDIYAGMKPGGTVVLDHEGAARRTQIFPIRSRASDYATRSALRCRSIASR